MPLPVDARRRLLTPLLGALAEAVDCGQWHTVPVAPTIWNAHTDHLFAAVDAHFVSVASGPSDSSDYNAVKAYVCTVLDSYHGIVSRIAALSPFEPFDPDATTAIVRHASSLAQQAARHVLGEDKPGPSREVLNDLMTDWPAAIEHSDRLCRTFGVDEQLVDDLERFVPSRVLAAYVYRNGTLLTAILPHLRSLGFPIGADLLANVSVLGWIVTAPDPVVAFASTHAYLTALLVGDVKVVCAEQNHFAARERQMNQTRRRLGIDIAAATSASDSELQALNLASAFSGIAEGFVRHYAWALRCLEVGRWSQPPMLTPLRDALVGHGGLCAAIAERCLLIDFRNGEAHEDLAWDGFRGVYVRAKWRSRRVRSGTQSSWATRLGWAATPQGRRTHHSCSALRSLPHLRMNSTGSPTGSVHSATSGRTASGFSAPTSMPPSDESGSRRSPSPRSIPASRRF